MAWVLPLSSLVHSRLRLPALKSIIDFLWVVLAAAGIILIEPWGNKAVDVIGVLLALLAGAFWAAYILIGGHISKIMDGRKAATIGMIFASVLVLPIAMAYGLLSHLRPAMFVSGLGLALLSSAIPFMLEMGAQRKIPAKTFSILMSLEPAVAALTGLVFLHEYLSFYEWLAVAMIIVASAGATLTKKKPANTVREL